MASRKFLSALFSSKHNRKRLRATQRSLARRDLKLESLEQRQLLAVGPSLVAIRPDVPVGPQADQFLREHDFLNEAPRELVLQFSPGQFLDGQSLTQGIQMLRAGGDGQFTPASASWDFRSNGLVEIGFEAARLGADGNTVALNFVRSDLGLGNRLAVAVTDTSITVTFNTVVATPVRAAELVSALNAHPRAGSLMTASIVSGNASADIQTPLFAGGNTGGWLTLQGANAAQARHSFGGATVRLVADVEGLAGDGIAVVVTTSPTGTGGVTAVRGKLIEFQANTSQPTTAQDFVTAINTHPAAGALVNALLVSGSPTAPVTTAGTITLRGGNDVAVTPGYVGLTDKPNEAVLRFAETLPDDDYRLQVFGATGAAAIARTDFNTGRVQATFRAVAGGPLGNGAVVNVTKADRGPTGGVSVTRSGATVNIILNTNANNLTTAQALASAVQSVPGIGLVVDLVGDPTANIATPATNPTRLVLTSYRTPVMNVLGEAFNDERDQATNFQLDLAPGVISVVPQPIARNTQRIELVGVTGGTFRLSFAGETTAAIAFNATAVQLRAALADLSNLDAADLTVTKIGAAWEVTIAGQYAGKPIPLLVANASGLTGAANRQVRISQVLSQSGNQILVHFNADELERASAENPAFYQLIDTQGTLSEEDDTLQLPQSVTYDSARNLATLVFAGNITDGTYRLKIGGSDEVNDSVPSATNLGTLFDFVPGGDYVKLAYTGDNTYGANDVDLYRFELFAGAQITADVTPHGTHTTGVRLFRDTLSGVVEVTPFSGVYTAAATEVLYLGIASAGNTAYDPKLPGSGAGGTSRGSYLLRLSVNRDPLTAATTLTAALGANQSTITVADASRFPATTPFTVEIRNTVSGATEHVRVLSMTGATWIVERGVHQTTRSAFAAGATSVVTWLSDDNSSFATAVRLGTLGVATKTITSAISSQEAFTKLPPYPGGNDEPGHRHVPVGEHLGPVPPNYLATDYGGFLDGFDLTDPRDAADFHDGVNLGRVYDTNPAVTVMDYNFQDVYGLDLQGNELRNAITENQKQRTREIFELWSRYTGIQFRETANSGITVVTGDMRAVNATTPVGPGEPFGKAGRTNTGRLAAIMDSNETDYGSSEYGGKWFKVAFQMIGHTLGLGNSYDLPSIMGNLLANTVPGGVGLSGNPVEAVFPGDQDIVHVQRLHQPDGTDIDLFKFTLPEAGFFSAETIAERLPRASMLNSALRLYRETPGATGLVRELISQNDDYYGNDSYIGLELQPGTYYIGVSSTGNTSYDPVIADTGGGGTTDGEYQLVLRFQPSPRSSLQDKAPAISFLKGGSSIADGRFVEIQDGGTLRRFEFNSAGGVAVGAVPVPFTLSTTPPELARALADAINSVVGGGVRAQASGSRIWLTGSPSVTLSTGLTAGDQLLLSRSVNPVVGTVEGLPLDGDSDGVAGESFQFWFQAGSTLFVDKATGTPAAAQNGGLNTPFSRVQDALQRAGLRIMVPTDAPASIVDGQTFVIDDGVNSARTFEFDKAGGVSVTGHIRVDLTAIAAAHDPTAVAQAIRDAINSAAIAFNVTAAVDPADPRAVNLTPNAPSAADSLLVDRSGTPALMTASNIVRIVGNSDPAGDPNSARPYLIGLDDLGLPLPDGSTADVPQGVTLMIDEGALFKMQRAIVDVGSATPTVLRNGAALQVLGTPESSVFFRSYHDDAIGGNSDGTGPAPMPGDWGGLVLRNDSDAEDQQIFLNWINFADINRGGGRVQVGSIQQVFNPIHLETARPTIAHNLITQSADAAISADPNSFEDSAGRIGPDIHGNRLLNNSVNGLFVRIRTQAGVPLDKLEVPARWNDRDIVHVVTENLHLVGAPGGPVLTDEVQQIRVTGSPAAGSTFTLTFDGQTTRPIAFNAPANVNTNETQRVSVPATAASGTFQLQLNDERQSISIPATAIGGSFRVRFESADGQVETSPEIPFNATAAEVQTALLLMAAFQPGDVLVSGGPLPTNAVTVRFTGQYTALNLRPMVVVSSTITNGIATLMPTITELAPIAAGTSAPIPYNATANDVRAALVSPLYSLRLDPADIEVTGGRFPAHIQIEFRGRYAGRDLHGMTVSGNQVLDANFVTVTPTVTDNFIPVIVSVRQRLEELINIRVAERGAVGERHEVRNIVVSGGPLPSSPLNIQFVGAYAGQDVPLLVVNNAGMTGATVAAATITESAITARPAARLAVDPGLVVKLEGARIEAEVGGSQLIAEGNDRRQVVFTALKDDRYGAAGTFDTTSNGDAASPAPGQWGGLIFNAGSSASIDHALITFGGGRLPIEGNFDQFNAIEVHQARLRLTNSVLENNASGLATSNRNGRGANREAVVFVRGAQPIIVDNIFRNNTFHDNLNTPTWTPVGTHIISINANALNSVVQGDYGRTTGEIGVVKDPASGAPAFSENRGPLIRRNLVDNNGINGMEVRGEELTTETIWDDTDIVHVLRDEIVVLNHHTYSGLRLQSGASESLVVKLAGNPNDPTNRNGQRTGFTANGTPLDINDRIGGTVQVLGFPDFPVILTSLADDTQGASFNVDGQPHRDTNNDGSATKPAAGDWRGILLEKYSNDRNVTVVNETESSTTSGMDANPTPALAQFLGELAPNEKSGDENRTLGFTVNGFIAVDDPTDVDVYSFQAPVGTEIWIDIDRTSNTLDAIVELITQNGSLLARSVDNNSLTSTPGVTARNMQRDERLGVDFYSTNPRDPGMRVVLPGTGNGLGTYFIRVRSNTAPGDVTNVKGGLTRGSYQLQVRLRQEDEKGGSNIRFANILYPRTGIDVRGLPAHSPLTGETAEADDVANNTLAGAQNVGNLLEADRNTISIAGRLSSPTDVDWYRVEMTYSEIQAIAGVNDAARTFAAIFDIDYADQLRADTVLTIYDEQGNLIFVSRDSDILDDQPLVGQGNNLNDPSRGSVGKLDPYIGPVHLPAEVPQRTEVYYVAVSSNLQLPRPLDQTFNAATASPHVRLEPINALQRVVEDHIGFTGYTTGSDLVGTDPNGPRAITPTAPAMLQMNTPLQLSTHVVPFTLTDVQLYVTTTGSLSVINPFTGDTWYTWINNYGYSSAVRDLVMRTDGRLFAYRNHPTGQVVTAGRLEELNVGTIPSQGAIANNDNIPDDPAATPIRGTNTNTVEAVTARRTNNNGEYRFYYSVSDNLTGFSNLYVGARVDLNNNDPSVNARNNDGGFLGQISGPGVTGFTTGMAFNNSFNQLYGVSSGGQFYRIALGGGGMFGLATLIRDFRTEIPNVSFSGLAIGPQNLADGAYRDMFFATTATGRMYAFDLNGNLQPIFDTDPVPDGVADSYEQFIPSGVTGLAFSPLDFNLWHPTARRSTDAGHGIERPFDASRDVNRNAQTVFSTNSSLTTSESIGGASFYFGLEQDTQTCAPSNQFFCYGQGTVQYGILSNAYDVQRDLTTFNDTIGNNYNLPGGAHGILVTNPFSLEGYARTDKPTLYFNYFLDTQVRNHRTQALDTARVFISKDDGASWELLATNNTILTTIDSATNPNAELPTHITTSRDAYPVAPNQGVQELFDIGEPGAPAAWRQARVDLADWAGEGQLKLRFDFTTAGSITPDYSMPGDIHGWGMDGDNGTVGRGRDNRYEGFYIDDIIIGFAERGEMITGPADQRSDSTFFQVPQNPVFGAPVQSLVGEYQLEIRRGTEYVGNDIRKADWNDPNDPFLPGQQLSPIIRSISTSVGRETKILTTFDTNERFVSGDSILAPAGNSLSDGQYIVLTDGVNVSYFEFDNDNNVAAGRERVGFLATDSPAIIAQNLAAAINRVGPLQVTASVTPTSNRVDLTGNSVAPVFSAPLNLTVDIAADSVLETAGANATTVTVRREGDTSAALTVRLDLLTNASRVSIPATVVIPAGQASVTFPLATVDNAIAEGTQTVVISASASPFTGVSDRVDVIDDERPELTLVVTPGTVSESAAAGSVRATISRNTPTTDPLTVSLASLDPSEILIAGAGLGSGVAIDTEPNNSISTAQDLDGLFSLSFDTNIGDSFGNTSTTIPHVTIVGSGDFTFDYYSFTVGRAGDRAIFDIDQASFDTEIFLYDTLGNLLAENDDSLTSLGAGGSTSSFDSYLEYTFSAPGTYVIGVGRFPSSGSFGGITGLPPLNGDSYLLQVSLENAARLPSALATLTIPAGETSVTVDLAPVDDFVVDGDQVARLVAFAPGFANSTNVAGSSDTVTVTDSARTLALTLTIGGPTSFLETAGPGASSATVTRNHPGVLDLVLNVISTDTSEARVPAQVIIPAGQLSATFSIDAVDDPVADGDQTVLIKVYGGGLATQVQVLTVLDDGVDTAAPGAVIWIPQGPGPATNGQTENIRRTPGGPVTNDVTGAVHTVVAHPTNANILYIGATNGGVWRTTNALDAQPTWTPLTDHMPANSIGALEFDLADPTYRTLIAGIGHYSAYGLVGSSLTGLILTTDGGNTWTQLNHPLLQGRSISGVRKDGNLILVTAQNFGGGTGGGVYRSNDGGTTFTLVSGTGGLAAGAAFDIVHDVTNPNRYYVSVQSAGIFRSDDRGVTWTNVSAGNATLNNIITSATNNNTEMAVASNGRLYVAVLQNGQARYIGFTSNLGATWTAMDLPYTPDVGGGADEGLNPREKAGGQGMIHFSIVVDPTDPNIVYVGGDRQDDPFPNFIGAQDYSGRLFRGDTRIAATGAVPSPQWGHLTHRNDVAQSPTGGTASTSSPHADSREMTFDANGNLIEVDDAGIYRRTNPRSNTGDWFSIIGNLQVTEMHDVAYDPISKIIISGNQDTGTTQQVATGSFEWFSVSTADGGDVAVSVDPSNPNQSVRYSSFQNLGWFRRRVYDASNNLISETFPALNGFVGDAQFVTPVEINAVDPSRLVIGGWLNTYESFNQGDSVNIVGAVGVNAIDGDPLAYGGRRNGVDNPDVLYVGSGNSVYVRTTAGGPLTASPTYNGGAPTDIALDPNDWMTAFVTDFDEVRMTTDAGASWTDITGDLGALLTDLHSIVYLAQAVGDAIFVGGLTGVARMALATPGVWQMFGAGLPSVPVWDLAIDALDDILVAGTFGRGAWTTNASGIGGGLDLEVTVDPMVLSEDGFAAPTSGTVRITRDGDTTNPLDVTLTYDATQVSIAGNTTGTVVIQIPAAAAFVDVAIVAVNDTVSDGTQTVVIVPSALGFDSVVGLVDVLDDAEDANLTIRTEVLAPREISEQGGVTNAQITRSDGLGAISVTMVSSDTSEATTFPTTFTMPDGQVTRTVQVRGVNDTLADGTQTVLLIPTVTGGRNYLPIYDVVDILDNEPRQITVTLAVPTISETAGPNATTGTVNIGFPRSDDLTVYLLSSDPSEARVPESVVIPAGSTTATFPIEAIDEVAADGLRTVTIFAFADTYRSGLARLYVMSDADGLERYDRLGDSNLHRGQGQLRIEGNVVRFPSEWGINVEASSRDNGTQTHPGPVRNLPTLNTERLVPGASIENNVVANLKDAAGGGIRLSGDAGVGPVASAPFARLVNNTVFGEPVRQQVGGQTLADFVFLLDTSSSLANDIQQLRNRLATFDQEMTSRNISARYGLVTFPGTNPDDNPRQLQDLVDFASFTAAGSPFLTFPLAGDVEKGSVAILEAFNQFDPATTFNFRAGAVPVPIVLTDEDDDSATHDAVNALAALLSNNAVFFGITADPASVFGGNTSATYGAYALATNGQRFNIDEFRANPAAFMASFSQDVAASIAGVPAGTGMLIEGGASPTILNNVFANLNTGLEVRPTAATTVIGANFFQQNNRNTNNDSLYLGTNAIVVQPNAQGVYPDLFVDEWKGNFYLAANSNAIDSSLNSFQDRQNFVAVKSPLGIPASPIVAPNEDLYGQKRVDDPTQNAPPGLGQDIFKDRGAIERADFDSGFARLVLPADNDLAGLDVAPESNVAWLVNPSFPNQFVVELVDNGVGIDDTLVSSLRFQLYKDGFILRDGEDYFFTYNSNSNRAIFTALTTYELDSFYTIVVDRSEITGIRDLAGNRLLANQPDGSIIFAILLTDDDNDAPQNSVPGELRILEDGQIVFSTGGGVLPVPANGAQLLITERDPAGTAVNVQLVNPGVPNAALTLDVSQVAAGISLLRASLATDASGNVTTTTDELIAAIQRNAAANALVTVTATGTAAVVPTVGTVGRSAVIVAGNQTLTFTRTAGAADTFVVNLVDPGAGNPAPIVQVTGAGSGTATITVQLATNGGGNVISTTNDIVTAIQASTQASALVTVSTTGLAFVSPASGTPIGRRLANPILVADSDAYLAQWETASRALQQVTPEDGQLKLTLTASNGTLALPGVTGLTFVAGGNGMGMMTIAGTIAQLNAALNGLLFIPAADHNDDVAPTTILVQTEDEGRFGPPPGAAPSRTDEDAVTVFITPVNDPPVAVDDPDPARAAFYVIDEDSPTPLIVSAAHGVLANDFDVPNEGQTLTAILMSPTSGGSLTLHPDGSFEYRPNPDFNGLDTFTYKVNDGIDDSNVATATITVNPTNDPPIAVPDVYDVDEDSVLIVAAPGVLANDSDPDGGAWAEFAPGFGPTKGALTWSPNNDGSFRYTPEPDFFGQDFFGYYITDGVDVSFALVTINVLPVNDPPVANDNSYTLNEDQTLAVPAPGVLANDTDIDGDVLTPVLATPPTHGILTLNSDGSFSYTPALDYFGADSFTYRANDGSLSSPLATVFLTINPVNDPPIAFDDSYSVDEDQSLVVAAPGLLANDVDVDRNGGIPGHIMSARLEMPPVNGTVFVNFNGSFVYTPNPNFYGTDTFTYAAFDVDYSSIATVTITVRPVNDAPVAFDDTYTVPEDSPLVVSAINGVLRNDTDIEGDRLTAVLVSGPTRGSLTLNSNGAFTYVPNPNFNGQDTFTYRAADQTLQSNVATVTIDVTPVNDPPVAFPDFYATNEDVTLSVPAPGVLGNDVDIDGDVLTAVLVTPPTQGTLVLNSNGSFSYTPALNYYGPDSFTYRAFDGTVNSNLTTVSLTVNPVNDPPVAVDDSYAVNQNEVLTVSAANGVLANDTDVEGDPLRAVLVSAPLNGNVTLNPNGSFVYTPQANFSGTDSFTYRANDNVDDSNVATVVIRVNAKPVAVNDGPYVVAEDAVLVVAGQGVLFNDTDADGDTLTAMLVTGPTSGSLTLNPNGLFTYTPNPDFFGADTFTYKANDGVADSNVATVTITVTPVQDAPVARDDAYTVSEDSVLNVPAPGVLANDTDADGDTLQSLLVSPPQNGALALSPNGGFVYTPNQNFFGTDNFTYRAVDPFGNSSNALVVITVLPEPDPPVAFPDSYRVNAGSTLTVGVPGVLANDIDVDGDTLTAALIPSGGTRNGVLTLNANGSFVYQPNTNFQGQDSFIYVAIDSTGLSSAPVQVTISVDNPRPWQNPNNRFDVSGDGFVSAIDALQIINRLNRLGAGVLPVPPEPPDAPPPYVDVDGDNLLTPTDALQVINRLNNGGSGEGPTSAATSGPEPLAAEGEQSGAADSTVLAAAFLRTDVYDSLAPAAVSGGTSADTLFAAGMDDLLFAASRPQQPAAVPLENVLDSAIDDVLDELLDSDAKTAAEGVDRVLAELFG